MQKTQEAQAEVKRSEIEALNKEGEVITEGIMAVRRELGEVAVQRGVMEGEQQRVMVDMQEQLSEVVKEGTRHEEDMKEWMSEQREERERMMKALSEWKGKVNESIAEQRHLAVEVERMQGRRRLERQQQTELTLLQQIATQNNNSATFRHPSLHTQHQHTPHYTPQPSCIHVQLCSPVRMWMPVLCVSSIVQYYATPPQRCIE